jgi:cyclopropane fatty-acyl-phospholipid synthase-like methyltransferase
MESSKNHWEKIYSTKKSNEVSWTQGVPETSLNFLKSFNLSKDAAIIDIGGGESKLVDFLLEEGFTDITVLDISETALTNAKERLGSRASQVQWIVSDITEFKPDRKYHVWHDRATFHFLTNEVQIAKYVALAADSITADGFMTIGTFSEAGPTKCSGLEIKQYSEQTLQSVLTRFFDKLKCITEDHITPFQTLQNFLFCSFKKRFEVADTHAK